MNKILLATILLLTVANTSAQVGYEYTVVTSVESIVPNGLGRSRIISTNEKKNHEEYTTTQTAENNSRNKSDRASIRVKDFDETKLLNFYNLTGLRFQNIAANDALITSKINKMVDEGWELVFVNSAVESAGYKDNQGIFITRYIFKKKK